MERRSYTMAISSADSLGLRYQGVLSTTNATTVATVPATKTYSAIKTSFSNNHASTGCTVEVFLVPSGQSATNTYRILPPTLVPAGVEMEYSCPHELAAGYTVQVKASVENLITCMVSARELS